MEVHRTKTGFTLIELLIVTAVIMILVSIVVFSVQGTYAYAMRLKCQHRMEQVWYACNMYHNDNRGKLPQAWDFEARAPWYVNLYDEGYLDRDDAAGCPLAEADPLVESDEETGGSGGPGPPPSEEVEAIYMGLRWLAANTARIVDDPDCPANEWDGDELYWPEACRHGATAFAVMAFLRFGFTPEDRFSSDPDTQAFGEALYGGLKDLIVEQNPDTGFFLENRDDKDHSTKDWDQLAGYDITPGATGAWNRQHQHAVVTWALAMAHGLLGDQTFHSQFDDYWDDTYGAGAGYAPVGYVGYWPERSLAHAAEKALDRPDGWWDVRYRPPPAPSIASWEQQYGGGWAYWNAYPGWPLDGFPPTHTVASWAWDAVAEADAAGLDMTMRDSMGNPTSNTWLDEMDGWLDITEGPVGRRYDTGTFDDRFTAMCLSRRIERHGVGAADTQLQLGMVMDGEGGSDPGRYLNLAPGGDLWYVYFMTEALAKVGGTPWENWCGPAFQGLIDRATPGPMVDGKETHYWGEGLANAWSYRGGDTFATALACMAMEIMTEREDPGGGPVDYLIDPYSFGYNRLLGLNRRTPAGDTVVLVDYLLWGIRTGDPMSRIAPRHAGRVNVLFPDGRVDALYPEELKDGMWTPEPGD